MWLDKNRPNVPREGQRWGPFEVVKEIARGNMGVVFHAKDAKAREVALKILLVQHQDEDASERFKREAKSLARLAHPNIVSIHDYGVQDGIPFLTMDYVAGTTLQELLERAALPLSRSVALLAQIARGADHAHSRGVLHRDLKPANVLIGPDGKPHITDFGLARITDASVSLTNDGDVIGTPIFMSPEQIQGTLAELGPPSDVWSLGVTLYLMLTGSLPFRGRTVDEVSRQVVQQDPAPPGALSSNLPEDLERICMTALDKDPRKRYQTAGEMALDLEAYLRGKPVLAGKVTFGIRARRTVRFMRLHPRLSAIAVSAALVLAGVGLLVNVRSSDLAERNAQTLLSLSAEKRDKAWHALRTAQAALNVLEPEDAVDHSRQADRELDWAAAYLARAGRLKQVEEQTVLETALELRPEPDEVKAGTVRDPALSGLRGQVLAIRSQAQAMGAASADDENPAEALAGAFERDGDLSHLEALAGMARRLASPVLAQRANALAHSIGAPTATAHGVRLLRLLVDLADMSPGGDARELWRDHLGEGGPLDVLAAELEAGWSLAHGDLTTASETFPVLRGVEPPARRLLRVRLTRAQGDRGAHSALLAPLLKRRDVSRISARLELAEALIDRGRPRQARVSLDDLMNHALPPTQQAHLERVVATARWLAHPQQRDPFWRALHGEGLPLLGQLETARQAVLHDPAIDLPELQGGEGAACIRRARDEVALASLAPQVEAALSRVALRLLGLPQGGKARHEDVVALRRHAQHRPSALAAAVILYLDREESPSAKALLDNCPLTWRQHSSVRVATRLRTATPTDTGSPFRVESPEGSPSAPPPRGLAQGQAALARALAANETSPLERHRALLEGLRALGLAVRSNPFHPHARLVRARLGLLRAADPTLGAAAADRARQRALGDAAVACAADPGSPAAWSVFCQALWVQQGHDQRDLYQRLLEPWIQGEGPSLEPHELSLLPLVPDLLDPGSSQLPQRGGQGEVGFRLLLRLVAAQRGGGKELRDFAGEPSEVGKSLTDAIERASDPFEAALLRACLLLERPSDLETFLRGGIDLGPGGPARLEEAIRGRRSAAGAAHVLRLLASLPSAAAADDEERRRLYRQGLTDLEAIAGRRPGPGWLALRAALEVWAGNVGRDGLPYLLAWTWKGTFYELLSDLAAGRSPKPQAEELMLLEPLSRLAAERR